MITPQAFYNALADAGVNYVVGVPDSLLKEFCAYADAVLPPERHLISVNEGTALAIGAGVHLATGGVPLVYLQNSGLGNAVNPLLSLADPEVYGIPLVLLVGWRGEPGIKDEPQHVKQGRVSPAMLKAMEIPFEILTGDSAEAERTARWAVEHARRHGCPVVILVRKGSFGEAEQCSNPVICKRNLLSRENVIELILEALPISVSIVSTTGMISRELYERRTHSQQDHSRDFLTVGSMGHASQIALGIALSKLHHNVVCLDGDGAALMHMGGLATIGTSGVKRYMHILLNNGVHDSVGGQPTVAFDIDFSGVARACGYKNVLGPITDSAEMLSSIDFCLKNEGPCFLEVHVKPGARADLGRPKESPAENKTLFNDRLRRL